jgi:hypothetical protein
MEGPDLRALNFDEVWLEGGDPDAEALVGVAQGAGLRVAWFAEKRMQRGQCPITTRSLVVGGLPSVKAALRFLGCQMPPPADYPDSLAPFLRRRVWRATLASAQAAVERSGQPIFVKPIGTHKRFTGVVIDPGGSWSLDSVPGRVSVWCSEVVTFESEFRAFVSDGQVVGLRHYWGDSDRMPDSGTIRSMVAAFGTHAPHAYALDVGLVPSGDTVLVEVTDGFTLGSYGLEPLLYLEVLAHRWRQLVGRPSSHA